jgi:hypothetical protein
MKARGGGTPQRLIGSKANYIQQLQQLYRLRGRYLVARSSHQNCVAPGCKSFAMKVCDLDDERPVKGNRMECLYKRREEYILVKWPLRFQSIPLTKKLRSIH